MRKKFITNLALVVALNLLIKPFWIFGIDRTIQNMVGAAEYGFYFSLLNFSFLLNILLDLGITNYNNRNIAQNNQLLSKSLSSIIGLRLLLAVGYFVISLSIAGVIGYEWRQLKVLLFLLLNQFLASFILYFRSNLSGLHYFKTDSLLSVLDRTLMIIICSFLIWGNLFDQPLQIEWFVYAQTVSYFLAAAIAFMLVFRKADFLKLNFDRTYFIAILRRSYPFALLTLLMAIYYRVDSVMLERMLPDGKVQAGIYAQGFRILDAVAMFAFLYAGLLLPMFSKMLKMKEAVNKLAYFSFLLLMIPVIALVFVAASYRQEIMDLLYHHHVIASSGIFGILIFCYLGIATSYIFGTLLTANGNLRDLNLMAMGGVLVNVILNLVFIPKMGARGSAIASLITQSLTAVMQILLVLYKFKFKLSILKSAKLFIYIIGVYLLTRFAPGLGIEWYYSFFILLAASVLFAFSIRLITFRDLYLIVKYGDE